jgi:hypothetical protein
MQHAALPPAPQVRLGSKTTNKKFEIEAKAGDVISLTAFFVARAKHNF